MNHDLAPGNFSDGVIRFLSHVIVVNDFVTVVLHEVCHGLGFSGSMHVANGLGYWGFGIVPFPTEYDRHTESGSGQSLLGYEYGSPALAVALPTLSKYNSLMRSSCVCTRSADSLTEPLRVK